MFCIDFTEFGMTMWRPVTTGVIVLFYSCALGRGGGEEGFNCLEQVFCGPLVEFHPIRLFTFIWFVSERNLLEVNVSLFRLF